MLGAILALLLFTDSGYATYLNLSKGTAWGGATVRLKFSDDSWSSHINIGTGSYACGRIGGNQNWTVYGNTEVWLWQDSYTACRSIGSFNLTAGLSDTPCFDLGTGCWAASPTNYYCTYNVCWTNNTGTRAYPVAFYIPSGGGVQDLDDFSATSVSPGNYVCRTITVNIGTNAAVNCGQIAVGNGANPEDVLQYYDGTRTGTTETPPSDGMGTATNNIGPIMGGGPGSPGYYAGGSTNLVTQGDIYKLGDTIVKGGADVGDQIKRGLDAIAQALTNGTMGASDTNSLREQTFQNYTNMANQGNVYRPSTNISSSWTNFDASTNVLGSLSSRLRAGGPVPTNNVPAHGAAPATMLLSWGGYEVNTDPEAAFPGIMSTVKSAILFLAMLAFAAWAANHVWQVAQAWTQIQGGGVPNIEATVFGVGGNLLGVSVALLVSAAVITGAVWGMNLVLDGVFATISAFPSVASVCGGTNAIAIYLVTGFIPVTELISMWTARMVLPYVSTQLVMVAWGAMRFLFTH